MYKSNSVCAVAQIRVIHSPRRACISTRSLPLLDFRELHSAPIEPVSREVDQVTMKLDECRSRREKSRQVICGKIECIFHLSTKSDRLLAS